MEFFKSKWFKVFAGVTGAVLLFILLGVYEYYCGNIFVAMTAKAEVAEYIAEKYPDNDYEISDAKFVYDPYDGSFYGCRVTDPNSIDGSFDAKYYSKTSFFFLNFSGECTITDTYEYDVTYRHNTFYRLEELLKDELRPILDTYTKDGEFEYIIPGLLYDMETDRSRLSLNMLCDTKNMPLDTDMGVRFVCSPSEGLKRIQEVAGVVQELGYRIDYYTIDIKDGNEYYSYWQVPREELVKATCIDDLLEYIVC